MVTDRPVPLRGASDCGRHPHPARSVAGARRPIAGLLVAGMVASAALTGCQANPGDAPTVEDGTPTTTTTPTLQPKEKARELRELSVGVDEFGGNLNPHLVGNVELATAAVADLTLPSAFTFDGRQWNQNRDLIASVDADNPAAPTKVVYKLTPQSQWSDGTPITGADFQYLRDVSTDQPLSREAEAYSHIRQLTVDRGGLQVEVTFTCPYAPWRQLFHHLLPSHIYRAEGQEFATMMDGRSAASGGPFSVASVDSGRGVLQLQRNDRYWGPNPAKLDKIILTAVPGDQTGAQMLRSGQIQMVAARPTAVSETTYGRIPGVSHKTSTRDVQLNATVNARSGRMADRVLRQQVLKAIDRKEVAQVATGRPDVDVPEWSVPQFDGIRSVAGPTSQEPLIVGAPAADPAAVAASRTIADQLTTSGLPARAISAEPAELLGTTLPQGGVDILVQWGMLPQSEQDLSGQFACVSQMVSASRGGQGRREVASTMSKDTPPATPEPRPASETDDRAAELPPVYGANLTGTCDPDITDALDKMNRGEEPLEQAREAIVGRVKQLGVMVPIVRDSQLIAGNKQLSKPVDEQPSSADSGYSGVFTAAMSWQKQDSPPTDEPTQGSNDAEPSQSPQTTAASSSGEARSSGAAPSSTASARAGRDNEKR
ncbi:ABC transporter family substrate-binding protein [Corynebacterium heidelbergense]|uniref:Solute-binding protein family 5 domain-containing protein n=1 Tax=Corynebacterium heidelbergense TaxID=2055947 RepID=A0A364V5B0_9CORY|nr:ABC transporter family substrate-binding protein [Corynebacterium heidelbergense]RAV31840.1 hypothetical protein DLJ54_06215 [Corynebacterium heidelbergense]